MNGFGSILFSVVCDINSSTWLHRGRTAGIGSGCYRSFVDDYFGDLSKLAEKVAWSYNLFPSSWSLAIPSSQMYPNPLTSSVASLGWRPITYTRFFCTTRMLARWRRLAASISFCCRSFSFFSRLIRAILKAHHIMIRDNDTLDSRFLYLLVSTDRLELCHLFRILSSTRIKEIVSWGVCVCACIVGWLLLLLLAMQDIVHSSFLEYGANKSDRSIEIIQRYSMLVCWCLCFAHACQLYIPGNRMCKA